MPEVRTRFAPSPTGYLHIGGLRTALYGFLWARHNNGTFILRIEDTDRARLVDGAIEDIIESLSWAGIKWDEGPDIGGPYGPYLQSERLQIYRKYAEELIEKGKAYRCFCTPHRLEQVRKLQREKGERIGYDGYCRGLSEEEIKRKMDNGEAYVIRLKLKQEGVTVFKDLIRGEIESPNSILDDHILIKSDGYPTYHMANVVDDHLMKITHVIRGDEWISSTPRHIALYRAFEWETPEFAHVPVILAESGGKLSKRHGATTVREFRENGYLPEALLNFVALLGWGIDDKTEIIDIKTMIKHFDITKVNKASAIFSYNKLDWFNGVYIRNMEDERLLKQIKPFIIKSGLMSGDEIENNEQYLKKIIPLIKERLKNLKQAPELIRFFFDKHYKIVDDDSLIPRGLSPEEGIKILSTSKNVLEKIRPFNEKNIEEALRNLVNKLGLKPAQIFMPLRVAVTGSRVSPGLFETMAVLGEKRTIKRIENGINILKRLKKDQTNFET